MTCWSTSKQLWVRGVALGTPVQQKYGSKTFLLVRFSFGIISVPFQFHKALFAALLFCHRAGVAHLDVSINDAIEHAACGFHRLFPQIKPENIILCPGDPTADGSAPSSVAKLADFGTALIQESSSFDGHTFPCKKIVGSPHYAAPEIVELRKAIARRKHITEAAAAKKRTKSPWSFLKRSSNSAVVPLAADTHSSSPHYSQGSTSRDSELNVNPTWGWSSASQSTQSEAFLTSGSTSSPAAASGSDWGSQNRAAGVFELQEHPSPLTRRRSGSHSEMAYNAFAAGES